MKRTQPIMKPETKLILILGNLAFLVSLFLDDSVAKLVKSIRSASLDPPFSLVTDFTSVFLVLMAVTTLFLIQEKNRKYISLLWAAFALAIILSYGIKFIVARPRPTFELWYPFFQSLYYSFPSMHAAAAFSVLPLLKESLKKTALLWLAFALLVSFSRLYFSYHYLSDVIFGAFMGYLIGIFILYFEKKHRFAEKWL